MAKIVLGMGASHGPLLATPPEQWDQRVEADRRNPALVYRDGTFKFDELAKLRADENLEEQIKLPIKQKRYDACQRAMAEMARVFKEARPDIAVLVGNDQMEVFEDANIPAFMVCFGESVDNIPFSEEQRKKLPPGIEIAEPNHHGKTARDLSGPSQARPSPDRAAGAARFRCGGVGPAAAILVLQHIRASARLWFHLPAHHAGEFRPGGAVLHQHVLSAQSAERGRCFSLGKALCDAIASWDQDLRVAMIGRAGCRISWWMKSSTAAFSTP